MRVPINLPKLSHPRTVESVLREASYKAGDPREKPLLRELLESWIGSSCRFDRWAKANPEKQETLQQYTGDFTLGFTAGRGGKPKLVLSSFSPEGEEFWELNSVPKLEPYRAQAGDKILSSIPKQEAYEAFAALLICAGPRFRIGKCGCCGEFYWNRWGHANKRFCSRKCSQLQTAKEGQADRLATERREKNKRVRQAIRQLVDEKPATTAWKEWIASHAGVTKSYLTRTLNRGIEGKPEGLKLTTAQTQYLESKGESRHVDL